MSALRDVNKRAPKSDGGARLALRLYEVSAPRGLLAFLATLGFLGDVYYGWAPPVPLGLRVVATFVVVVYM